MDAPTTILIEIMLPVKVCEKQHRGDHSRCTAERICPVTPE